MEKSEKAKIAITAEAAVALIQTLEKVNAGNAGGRVNKLQMASWLILKSATELSTQNIDEIRRSHFNQATYLENVLRTLRQSGRSALSAEELENIHSHLKPKTTPQRKTIKTDPVKNRANSDPEKIV